MLWIKYYLNCLTNKETLKMVWEGMKYIGETNWFILHATLNFTFLHLYYMLLDTRSSANYDHLMYHMLVQSNYLNSPSAVILLTLMNNLYFKVGRNPHLSVALPLRYCVLPIKHCLLFILVNDLLKLIIILEKTYMYQCGGTWVPDPFRRECPEGHPLIIVRIH